MTISVNIHEAKTQLSQLLAKAMAGEDIVICNRNEPQVRLVPVEKKPKKKREFGQFKGQFEVPDSFFDPMTEEELALWYDSPIFPEDPVKPSEK